MVLLQALKHNSEKLLPEYLIMPKYAKAISDRLGLEFPYDEMVTEWNGSFVHISEYEEKHPQLELEPNQRSR